MFPKQELDPSHLAWFQAQSTENRFQNKSDILFVSMDARGGTRLIGELGCAWPYSSFQSDRTSMSIVSAIIWDVVTRHSIL